MVDSNDLPLNVSREILQESRDVEAIRSGCVKRVLDLLEDLAEKDKEKYATFWTTFGKVLKEGFVEDAGQPRASSRKLLRFASTRGGSDAQDVALADYVARMKEGQQAIYYVTARHATPAAANSPHLEIFRKKGIEVLLLSDRIDEWVASSLTEFDGKPLRSVAQGRARPRRARRRGGEGRSRSSEAGGAEAAASSGSRRRSATRVKDVRVDAPAHRFAGLPRRRRGRALRAISSGC